MDHKEIAEEILDGVIISHQSTLLAGVHALLALVEAWEDISCVVAIPKD